MRQLDRNSGELQLKGIVLLLEAGEADDEVKKVNEIIDTNVPFYLRKGKSTKEGAFCAFLDKNGLSSECLPAKKISKPPPSSSNAADPFCSAVISRHQSFLFRFGFILQCHFCCVFLFEADESIRGP